MACHRYLSLRGYPVTDNLIKSVDCVGVVLVFALKVPFPSLTFHCDTLGQECCYTPTPPPSTPRVFTQLSLRKESLLIMQPGPLLRTSCQFHCNAAPNVRASIRTAAALLQSRDWHAIISRYWVGVYWVAYWWAWEWAYIIAPIPPTFFSFSGEKSCRVAVLSYGHSLWFW